MAHTDNTDPYWVLNVYAADREAQHSPRCVNNMDPGFHGTQPCTLDADPYDKNRRQRGLWATCNYWSETATARRFRSDDPYRAEHARRNNRADRARGRHDAYTALKEYNTHGEVWVEHQTYHKRSNIRRWD